MKQKKCFIALTYLKGLHTKDITKIAESPRPKNWSLNFWLHSFFSIDLQNNMKIIKICPL